ncbi:MAG: hypothetical protein JSR27_13015 [Proteobacteria bacterium]|nr:hypothetical protein [Pseudomonadota bacterium]
MKKSFLVACGLATACTAAVAQNLNIEEQFLTTHGYQAVSVAPGVYEIARADGGTTRYAFGNDGVYYDLSDTEGQLTILQREKNKRSLNSFEIGMISDLQQKISALEKISALQKINPNTITAASINQGACGSGPGAGGVSLLADDPSTSTAAAGVAVADRPVDGFAPPPPNTQSWTLSVSSVIYLNSLKTTVLARESPAPITVYGPAQGRNSSYAYFSRGGRTCYGVSTASVTTNACSSPNNYQSVTDSTPCP